MSHPFYNPYASGNQGSTQGQYGLSSMQDERDPRRASSHLGPGSIYSSSGASSVTPANSGGMIPSVLPQMMSSRSEQSRVIMDGNIERSDQGTRFTSTQRDEFLSSGTGMASYPMSSTSASLGQRHSGVERGSSSLDWLLHYPRPTADDPSRFYSSSSSSNYASSEREHDMQPIPGLGDLDYPVPDKPAAPTESSEPKFTSESAFSILLQFGLEKEDLEHLLSYPEDQITPANLPFILRKILVEKTNKATTAVQSKPCPKPEPTRISGMDSHSLSSSGGVRMNQEEMSSAVFQPSNVIDYGHTSKYTGGVRDEIGRTSGSRANIGSMLPMDTYDSRHSQEPLQTATTEGKSSALGSSHNMGSSDSSLKSSYSSILSCVAPPSNDQTKQMQTKPNQMFQSILSSFFSPPNKDTDIRTLKSEVPKPVPLKEPVADHQSTSKTQPSSTLCRDVHPSRPGLMVIGSNVASGTKDQSKTPGQVSIVADQMKKQQTQQQPPQMQADLQTGKTMWPSVYSAVKSNPPASPIPSIIGVMQHPCGPRPVIIPPAQPQPISKPRNLVHPMPPPSKWQSPAKVPVSKGQPTVAMMHDYAAATPRIFPHTCCLCNKECPHMEDWIIHQNTNLHLESCRHLRKQYPDWDGDIALRLSAAGKGDKPSSSLQTAQHLQKARHGSSSCSRSPSPRRHHGSAGRKEKCNSRSLSPLCSRYTRRSRSRSHSPWCDSPTSSQYRSRSRSAERRSPPRRRDDKWSPPRRSDNTWSPTRREDRRSSPRWSDERRSLSTRSDKRLSPLKRSKERLSPPRRSDQRRSPPRRSNQRLSPPRRSGQRLSPPSRVDRRLSPPRRGDRRLSPQRRIDHRLSPPRRIDRRLSPPRRSDQRLSPPRRSDQRLSPPRRSDQRLSPSRRRDQRLSPPRRSDQRLSPPRGSDQRLLPPRRSDQRLSPPRRSDQRLSPPRGSDQRLSPSRRRNKRRLSPTRSDERRSPPRRSVPLRSPQRKKSSSTESLVKKLLETSAVQSLSNQSDLEAVAKILAPAFLAELAKMESSSPSSSSSVGGKPSSSSTASSSSFSTAKKKNLTKKNPKAKPDLWKREASSSTKLKETVSKKQKKPPHKKPATSSVSTPQTTATRKVLLPKSKMNPLKRLKSSSLPSGAKKAKTGKLTNQESAAKGSVTGPTTITKAKVLVSKAKNISDKQIAKMSKKDKLPIKGAKSKAVVKQKKVGTCTEGQEETPTTIVAVPDNSANKSSESQPPNSAVATQPKEASISALPHVQQRTLSEPECTAQRLEASHIQRRAAGSSTETAVEANLSDGEVETKAMHKDPVTAVKTQTDAASAKDASEHDLTIGEMVEKHLLKSSIPCIIWNSYSFQLMNQYQKMLLITNLPEYHNSSYTEYDIAKLLEPFGFQHTDNSIYVVPQTCMAFVSMPTVEDMRRILTRQGIPFKGFELGFHAVALDVSRMTPLGFYKTLMEWMGSPVNNDQSIVIVKNISWSETRELREALKKIDSVKNVLPLLNKVFIEFESIHDADRLGVWYSLLKKAPRHEVHRLIIPYIDCALHPPRLPQNALPDSKDAVAGATVPPMRFGIPQGSFGLYWVTMRTRPFLFPTVSPWFIIPDHLTVRGLDDIKRASERGSKFPTIMLTGFTVVNFKHEDVAKLVWRYFPKQNLHSLYYNVSVLTLQRRAFVFFADWTSCCDFVRDHIKNPVFVKGCWLSVHFVLEQMCPESSEETMYTTLMKWSNAGVPDPKSLEERLLCVEISETSMDIIKAVMEVVASIATFISFLPLANRICIEMADSSSVTKVVQKYNTLSTDYLKKAQAWSKVQHVDSVKSLKQRLQDSSEITINFGSGAINVKAEPPAVKCETQPLVSQLSDNGSQPALQTSGPGGATISEPIAAGPSATASCDVAMKEDSDKPGTEVVMDSTVGPQANEDAENATLSSTTDVTSSSAVSSGNTIPAASSPAPSATALTPEENVTELPRINTAIFQALKAAVRNHRLARESMSRSEDKKAPRKRNTISGTAVVEDTTQRKSVPSHEDFTDDSISSSSAFLFDDVVDIRPKLHRSYSSEKKTIKKQRSMEACRTAREMAEQRPDLSKIKFIDLRTASMSKRLQLLVTNLPEYHDGCYTEDDLAEVLKPFGFQYRPNCIYIVPQTRMAFITMPAVQTEFNIRHEFNEREVFLKGCRLHFQGIKMPVTLIGFYLTLMEMLHYPVNSHRTVVFIKNISWSETMELSKALKRISSVKNFLPLLNKAFIQFESICDADRIGVWYGLLKQAPGHEVHRLKRPLASNKLPRAPLNPEKALPDSKDAVAGATVPPMEVGIPNGSFAPFWITMKTRPFLFPTASPWFIIPKFLTIGSLKDIEVAGHGSMFPTVMLTGLPVENYKHEDVAELAWRYFPKRNLHSLYYNVVVLTLQRRAFVFFADWTSCCEFVRDHIKNPVSVRGRCLSVHFVLDHMCLKYSEEVMYTTLMKWSNAGRPQPKSLEERLLCVEISVVCHNIIRMVMELVKSIATFVSFIPLANRICIEMADSSGVTKVVDKCNNFSEDFLRRNVAWSKVQRVESVKSLKQRLRDSSEIKINLGLDPMEVEAEPAAVKCQTRFPASEMSDNVSQPALQTSGPGGSTISEPITVGPSDVAMEDSEKPGTEITMDSTVGPEANEDVEKAEMKGKELPQINTIFQVVKAALHNYRLTRKSRSQSESQDDVADDIAPSDSCVVDEQNFNMDDLVTIDEVDEDMGDTNPGHHRSTSKRSSRARRKRQSSGVSSTGKLTSTRSFKDSKSSLYSLFSSKLYKGSSSYRHVSQNKSKNLSDTLKSTKPSASASVSKASYSSSPLSDETPSSPDPKTQQNKTKSPAKPSNTASSHCSTRSSSAACEKESITSAATVKVAMETHSKPEKREEAKDTKSTVAKTDSKLSAEGIDAKIIESETTIETSSETQGHEVQVSQAMSLAIDLNVNTVKDQKESKENGEEDDADKHTKVEEDENHQILDSLDDQTDVPMHDRDQDCRSEVQVIEPEQGQTLCGEVFQVLDSVNDDNGATEDQAATGQEDSHLTQDDSFTVKQQSEEDAVSGGYKSYKSYKDLVGKDHETDDKDLFQSLHRGSKQAPTDNGDGKKRGKEDVKDKMYSAESCKASKDVENPGSQIPNENQAPQDPIDKETLKHPNSDFTDQETFEILDSIDDQTVTEDDSQNLETPIDQISKEDIRPMEEEEDTYQVVDSVEDQPTTLEAEAETSNKGKRNTRREAISRKDDRLSKRSCPTTRASSEEKKSPRKQDKKNDETQTKMDSNAGVFKQHKEVAEEIVYEIVDSVQDESVQDAATTERSGRRRSARGKKEDKMALDIIDASEKPEDPYEILDSVEDETDNDESTITTKSTSGRRERTTKKDASNEKMKKGETSTRGRYTPARESQEGNQEKTPTKEEKAPPKESAPSKTSGNVVSEEDTTYEVIDSVEDEVVQDDQLTTRRKGKRGRPRKVVQTTIKQSPTLKEEEKDTSEKVADEEEATYRILDSVEDDTVDDQPPTGQSKENNIKNNDQQTKKSGFLARSPKKEEEEEALYQVIDSLEDDQVQEELTATEDKTIDETKEEALAEKADASTCELRKRQASAKEKQFAKKQEVRRTRESEERTTREKEERERRSRSSSSSRGGGRSRARWAKDEVREEKMVEVDPKELVTLDEVGADDAGEERATKNQEWDQEITEGDLQALVTLDEFVEEEEDGKAKQSMLETRPPSQEDESVDFLNPETLVTLDEAGDEEEKPHQAQTVKTSRSAKRKHSDETVLEESMNFVTVDEVGEVNEEEEKEVVKTRTRGRAKKRTRQMPVRKSTGGVKVALKDEREEEPVDTDAPPPTSLDASSSLDKDPSMLSSDSQAEIQKTEVDAASRADSDASSVGQEQQLEHPENQTLDIKVLSKGRREPVRREAKRTRSQAPGVAASVKLAFKPNNPLESTGKDLHGSSQGHLENLQKHQQRQSRRSTQSSQSSVSD